MAPARHAPSRPPSREAAAIGRPPQSRFGEHTSELQSHRDLHSSPTRRSSDLSVCRYLQPDEWRQQDTRLRDRHPERRLRSAGRLSQDSESTRPNFNPTEIYTLPLHDALPIYLCVDIYSQTNGASKTRAFATAIPRGGCDRQAASVKIRRAHVRTSIPPRSTLFPYTTLFRSICV